MVITPNRPLPWFGKEPYDGSDTESPWWSIWDANGDMVAECHGEDQGLEEVATIVYIINKLSPLKCAECGAPPACYGSYEDSVSWAYACNECCGHGNEDGHCEPLLKLV